MLLSKFANEVLVRGPAALLPQNLNSEWLARLQKMADDFLDTHFQSARCSNAKDVADPVLTTCIS